MISNKKFSAANGSSFFVLGVRVCDGVPMVQGVK